MTKLIGSIRWFNNASGEGVVRCLETNANYQLHWSAIEGAETPSNTENYDVKSKNWVVVSSQQLVEFTPCGDSDFGLMVEKLRVIDDPESLVKSASILNLCEYLCSLEDQYASSPTEFNRMRVFYCERDLNLLISN